MLITRCLSPTFLWRNHLPVFPRNVMHRWQFVIFPLFTLLLLLFPVFVLSTVI